MWDNKSLCEHESQTFPQTFFLDTKVDVEPRCEGISPLHQRRETKGQGEEWSKAVVRMHLNISCRDGLKGLEPTSLVALEKLHLWPGQKGTNEWIRDSSSLHSPGTGSHPNSSLPRLGCRLRCRVLVWAALEQRRQARWLKAFIFYCNATACQISWAGKTIYNWLQRHEVIMIYSFSEACTQPLPISQKLERFLMTKHPEEEAPGWGGGNCDCEFTRVWAAGHGSLGSDDQRGEGAVNRFSSWKWEAAWSWLEGFPCWVGGLVLCPSFLTITQHLHLTLWFMAGRSRVSNGHLSSPMGNLMAETWGNARASSVLGEDQLAPRNTANMAAAKGSFLLMGQDNNSSPHSLKW